MHAFLFGFWQKSQMWNMEMKLVYSNLNTFFVVCLHYEYWEQNRHIHIRLFSSNLHRYCVFNIFQVSQWQIQMAPNHKLFSWKWYKHIHYLSRYLRSKYYSTPHMLLKSLISNFYGINKKVITDHLHLLSLTTYLKDFILIWHFSNTLSLFALRL